MVPPPYLVVPAQATVQWSTTYPGLAPNPAPAPAFHVPSFRKRVIVAFFLYFAGFFPGLIASFIWWRQARDFQRQTGIAPPGKGGLVALLGFGILVLAMWVLSVA